MRICKSILNFWLIAFTFPFFVQLGYCSVFISDLIFSSSEINCSILSYEPFILLLHQLGFHLPADAGKLFVRVPEFWTADILFNVAKKLGPIDLSRFIVNFNVFSIF